MPGKGKMSVTGNLRDVMKESIQAANAYVRSRSGDFGIPSSLFEKKDIHVHVPEGATPKDGPSAGVAMVTAIISIMTGIPVRKDVAMTGEITLRGRVLPIGGLKEKLLAALQGRHQDGRDPRGERQGPGRDRRRDQDRQLEIMPASRMDDVLKVALLRMPKPIVDEEEARAPPRSDRRTPAPTGGRSASTHEPVLSGPEARSAAALDSNALTAQGSLWPCAALLFALAACQPSAAAAPGIPQQIRAISAQFPLDDSGL